MSSLTLSPLAIARPLLILGAALFSNNTWTLCPKPPHRHVIHNKWVYKIKRHVDGSVKYFKARLVAKGFEQQSGIDYTETFSPVIKLATIRHMLALAIHFDWPIRQLDISNAFRHGSLNEEVYMEQPLGFVDPTHPDFVCKLRKAIYGLKQAPRAWYTQLSNFCWILVSLCPLWTLPSSYFPLVV